MERYIKVIESLGELLSNRDILIAEQKEEIKRLEHKIAMIEDYIEFYDNQKINER